MKPHCFSQCFPKGPEFNANVLTTPAATHAPITCTLDLDCVNTVGILCALQKEPHFFLLESATAEKTISRYSFFAYQMERRFRCFATAVPPNAATIDGGAELWLTDFCKHGQSKHEESKERLIASRYGGQQNLFETLFQYSDKISVLPPCSSMHAPKWQGFQGGLVGMFSYEAVRHMGVLRQPLRQLSTAASRYGQQPEMLFYEVRRFFVIDNASQKIFAVYLQPLPQERDSATLAAAHRKGQQVLAEMVDDLLQKLDHTSLAAIQGSVLPSIPQNNKQLAAELSRELWQEDQSEEQQAQAIQQLREELIAGEGLQVVYSVGRQGPRVLPSLFYRLLRRQNPSPYMFFFKDGPQHLVGCSPEIHLRYRDGIACIKPIAGTRPLAEGISADELQAIIDDLLQDPKERAEHLMLIDVARNDLYTHCQPDSVRTVKEFAPEVFSHVVHIVSEVQGVLKPGTQPYQLFAKTFPASTLSGAPKVRAIELIDHYEQSPRGFYGGCIGYFNYGGSFDSAIIIRSAWLDDDKTLVRSGSGLVYDSNLAYEIREHRQKLGILSTVMQAIVKQASE